jgi:hypothetical protein
MTTDEKNNQIREAVGVFGDADTMQQAIDDLLSSGFDRAELSLLASESTVDEKLGHKYKKVAEIEDDATVPRTRYVSPESIGEAKAALIGGLVFVGTLGATSTIVASGGALAAIITMVAIGAGTWGLLGAVLAELIGDHHAHYLQEHLKHGGLLLWVRCLNSEREKTAMEILSRHSGHDVHVHALPASV